MHNRRRHDVCVEGFQRLECDCFFVHGIRGEPITNKLAISAQIVDNRFDNMPAYEGKERAKQLSTGTTGISMMSRLGDEILGVSQIA